MTTKNREFTKGIRLRESAEAGTNSGDIRNDGTNVKVHLEGSEKNVVTEDQTQTLTNKTIDADNNTVSNLEVDNLKAGVLDTDLTAVSASDDTIPSAKAVKTYVDDSIATKDEASEISYDNSTSGLTATDVQAAVDEVEGRVDTAETNISNNATGLSDHLADTVDAHDASAISNVPAGNLAATDVQGALNELQTDIDTRATSADLTAHINDATDAHDASAISNVPAGNLAATDVQGALNELQTDVDTRATSSDLTTHTSATSAHGVSGDVVGTTDTQTLTNKTLTSPDINGGTIDGADVNLGTASDSSKLVVSKSTTATIEGLTREEGSVYYSTDDQAYFGDDGTSLIGLGGGVGSASIYKLLNAETGGTTGWTASAGTFEIITTGQLAGKKSYKWTPAAAANTLRTPAIDVPVRSQNRESKVVFPYSLTNDGVTVNIRKESDDALIATGSLDSNKKRAELIWSNSSESQIYFELQISSFTASMNIVFDDLEFNDEVFIKSNQVTTKDIFRSDGGNGKASTNTAIRSIDAPTLIDDAYIKYTQSTTLGDEIEILKDGQYHLKLDYNFNGAGSIGFSLNSTQLTTDITGITAADRLSFSSTSGVNQPVNVKATRDLVAGDVIRIHGNTNRGDGANPIQVSISVVDTKDAVLITDPQLEWSSPQTITIEATTTNPTKGTIVKDQLRWKRNGEDMQIRMEYQQSSSGSAGSGDYLIKLPIGYEIDTSKVGNNTNVQGVNTGWDADITVGVGAFSNGSDSVIAHVTVYDSTTLKLTGVDDNNSGAWCSTFIALNGSNVTASFMASVPIKGWGPTATVSVPVADKENIFSGSFDGSTGTSVSVTGENVTGTFLVSRSTTGTFTVDYSNLALTEIPIVQANIGPSGAPINATVTSVSTTQATIETRQANVATLTDRNFTIFLQKQGADYQAPEAYFIGNRVEKRTVIDSVSGASTKTGTIPLDSTIPQITEGDEIASVTFTPLTSKLEISARVVYWETANNSNVATAALFKDGANDAIKVASLPSKNDANSLMGGDSTITWYIDVTPGVKTTLSLRVGSNGGTWLLNSIDGNTFGGLLTSHLAAKEI